jgi:hypothetical protein
MNTLPLIPANWPAPSHIHAIVTTRQGGVSGAPWHSLNLGQHVGDNPNAVQTNRARLQAALQAIAPAETPQWLNQVHGITVAEAEADAAKRPHWIPDADAVTTTQKNLPCVVMTADCLPVFFCDKKGSRVAVAHAGWRGLCDGVLEATLKKFDDPSQVIVWMGPAIGATAFEVGGEVRDAFMHHHTAAEACFKPHASSHKYLADIYALARLRLNSAGITAIYGGDFCTVTEHDRFFSYRRDGQTGRMASVIWIA